MVWVKGELLDDFAQVHRLGEGQLGREQQPLLFDREAWLHNVWQHTPPGLSPLIARAQSEKCFAWLFLAISDPGRAIAMSNWYNFSVRPIFWGFPDEQTQRMMLVAIARRLKKGLARLALQPMRVEDAKVVQRAFVNAGWSALSRKVSTRWTADVANAPFAHYWAKRPGELKSTFKRKAAKSSIKCEIHATFDDEIWKAYEDVYRHSWKPDEGSFPFLKAMAQEEANAGCMRLGLAWQDGIPVAAQLWTIENGEAMIHKLAYREDAKTLSPGTILSEAMFRHAIDVDHVHEIDFGTGDDGYKAQWMDHAEPLVELRLYNPAKLDGLTGMLASKFLALAGRG